VAWRWLKPIDIGLLVKWHYIENVWLGVRLLWGGGYCMKRKKKREIDKHTVLFVCVHNSGRSQMAEAFLTQMAGGRVRALSAGTEPASVVDPGVIEVMREAGIDISGNKPKALTLEMLEQADKVVTMGCSAEAACPASFVETEEWWLEDPAGKALPEVRKIRDEIRERVKQLVEGLDRSR
jgi:arsenate reductase